MSIFVECGGYSPTNNMHHVEGNSIFLNEVEIRNGAHMRLKANKHK